MTLTRLLATCLLACAVAGVAVAQPAVAVPPAYPWQDIYRCSLFSSAVAELANDAGRKPDDFNREWDLLMSAALKAHTKDYLVLRPSAQPAELRAAWELDTPAVDKIFEADVDRAPDALDFLKTGYSQCAPLRAALLPKR